MESPEQDVVNADFEDRIAEILPFAVPYTGEDVFYKAWDTPLLHALIDDAWVQLAEHLDHDEVYSYLDNLAGDRFESEVCHIGNSVSPVRESIFVVVIKDNQANADLVKKVIFDIVWSTFSEILINDGGHILESFLHFPILSQVDQVWRWLQETFPQMLHAEIIRMAKETRRKHE